MIPNIDEMLRAFLEKWESTRVGQIEKHRLRAEHYATEPSMTLCYETARRAQRHYEHELAMLRELRARAIGPDEEETWRNRS